MLLLDLHADASVQAFELAEHLHSLLLLQQWTLLSSSLLRQVASSLDKFLDVKVAASLTLEAHLLGCNKDIKVGVLHELLQLCGLPLYLL